MDYGGFDIAKRCAKGVTMNPISAWQQVVLQNYANFKGRARRSEYWHYMLANVIAYVVLSILTRASGIFGLLLGVYWLAMIIPGLAVTIRRLHDTDKSGWFILVSLIPFVGTIVLLVFLFADSKAGTNNWGTSTKYPAGGTMPPPPPPPPAS